MHCTCLALGVQMQSHICDTALKPAGETAQNDQATARRVCCQAEGSHLVDCQQGLSWDFCDASAEQPELGDADISSEEAASAIRDSCLVPYLELELAQASFTDMGNRHAQPKLAPYPGTLHPVDTEEDTFKVSDDWVHCAATMPAVTIQIEPAAGASLPWARDCPASLRSQSLCHAGQSITPTFCAWLLAWRSADMHPSSFPVRRPLHHQVRSLPSVIPVYCVTVSPASLYICLSCGCNHVVM